MPKVKAYPSLHGTHYVEVLPDGSIGSIRWEPEHQWRVKVRPAITTPTPKQAKETQSSTPIAAKVSAVVFRHPRSTPSNQHLWKVRLILQQDNEIQDEVLADAWIPADAQHPQGAVCMALKQSEAWSQLKARGYSIAGMWEAGSDA